MIMLFKEPLLITFYVLSIVLIPCIVFFKHGYLFAFGFITTILMLVVFSFLKETTFLELIVELLILAFIFIIMYSVKRRIKSNDF